MVRKVLAGGYWRKLLCCGWREEGDRSEMLLW